jgi:hypothetical protein
VAVSFNSPVKYADDCVEDIARLRIQTDSFNKRRSVFKEYSFVEAEFASSGELGTRIVFTAFEEEFENNVVFIGERGDKLWNKNWLDSNTDFRFINEVYAGASMIEHRLRIGYIIVPMPLFGAAQWPSIHRISNSEEMQLYSIGGDYDRPIPRRIIETRGIARNMFGFKNAGQDLIIGFII